MIFVTLGTQDRSFVRLLQAIDKQITEGKIQEEIIVQAGHTKFNSDNMSILQYIPFEEFDKYIETADVIITHGGVGSIVSALKKSKKVIAVPRLRQYGEHTNDHQLQIISKMAEAGYIIDGNNLDELYLNIQRAKSLVPKEYVSNTDKFLVGLYDEINKLF